YYDHFIFYSNAPDITLSIVDKFFIVIVQNITKIWCKNKFYKSICIIALIIILLTVQKNKKQRMMRIMASLQINKRLIMTPGSVAVDPRVPQAMSNSILGQCDPEFTGIMNETMELIRKSFKTENKWSFPIDGTSRAGIEAVIASIVEPGDK